MAVKPNEAERQMIFTSKIVDEATDKINDGIVVKRYQNPWMKSEVGIRRAGVSFRMTPEEQQEYVRCALDIHYFTEKIPKPAIDTSPPFFNVEMMASNIPSTISSACTFVPPNFPCTNSDNACLFIFLKLIFLSQYF